MNNETCLVCGDVLMGGSVIKEKSICYDCLLEEQKEVMDHLSEKDINHVKGFSSLTEPQRKLLVSVYKKHLSGMGTVMRNDYMPGNLKAVKYDNEEKTVNVYFEKIWWHYKADHTWY